LTEVIRCQHYQFAHVALRSVAFAEPVKWLALLATPNARAAFASLLEEVAETCKERDEVGDFDASQLGLHLLRAGGHPCAVVEMPPPRATGEAYFTASVLLLLPDPEPAELRYFTLEYNTVDGATGTTLGEWQADGGHLNHGAGPEPNVQAFLSALSALLVNGSAASPGLS
jgi:hypothetical protein